MRKIFTFDCYGTLIDWLNGVKRKLKQLYPDISEDTIDSFIKLWGDKDFELVTKGVYRPYREILREGFKYALISVNLPYSEETINTLTESIKEWQPFQDTKDNLVKLSQIGEIGIISNTDREFILASIKNMDVKFEHIIVAEDIKLYKPDPKVFRKAKKILKIDKEDIWLHISSYPQYDIIPAKKAGVYTILLDRYRFKETNKSIEADEAYYSFQKLVEEIYKKFV